MPAVHDRRPPILHHPPPGSRLQRYVRYFEKLDEGPPDWLDPDPTIREQGARMAFLETREPCDLPFPVVREFILLPWLRDAGMPEGLSGPWFERLLNDATSRLFDKFSAEKVERDRLPSKNKGGLAKAPIVPAAIVLAAYLDTVVDRWTTLTYTRRCEIVARRLSGNTAAATIERSTILKVVGQRLDQIAVMPIEQQKICWIHHAVFSDLMSGCDDIDSFDRTVFYNDRAAGGCSGTRSPVSLPSSTTRG